MVGFRTSWVDVREVAEAHALALIKPAAGGERIAISAAPFKWQDFGKCSVYVGFDCGIS